MANIPRSGVVSIDSKLRKASWLCKVKGNMIDGLGQYLDSWREIDSKTSNFPCSKMINSRDGDGLD